MCIMFVVYVVDFLFFKQKTAYEMRISDWSSDVCSSDLINASGMITLTPEFNLGNSRLPAKTELQLYRIIKEVINNIIKHSQATHVSISARSDAHELRSEEHTSELQSLMRTSYDVFCLKKKKNITESHEEDSVIKQ